MDWFVADRDHRTATALRSTTPGHLDERAIRQAYRRWAPVYDLTFGRIAQNGRREAIALINRTTTGRVLEVGVGTGLALPSYRRRLDVVGIDLSPEMLDRARERVAEEGLTNVTGLHEMDAGDLRFPDASFDAVAAMYVMTVVPDAERVMRELARVTKPGGSVILVNHFSRDDGLRGWVERRMAPFADRLGWRPVFGIDRVMGLADLALSERQDLNPYGLFTLLHFRRLDLPQPFNVAA